jgi:putative hydrolase
MNAAIAGILFDLVAIQPKQASWGYKRGALTILGLDRFVTEFRSASSLSKIPNVGPSISRIILEYLDERRSPTAERMIDASGKADRVRKLRQYRDRFLSEAAARQILEEPGDAVRLDDYRGDFQMHSEWSDGGGTLDDMAEASIGLGHTCSCMTDHSYGLAIARGMSMDAVTRQQREIDRINRKHAGRFRMFKGIEANIRADGTVDMEPEELRRFELVIASPHSLLRKEMDQTSRMLGAVRHPGVHILGHPRGRRYNDRPGVSADWARVFEEAAARRVAVELDGYIDRQDIDYQLASEALARGCIFSLDSDAHSARELVFSRFAVAHARAAGIPSDRIINCWSDDRILAWAATKT